MALRLLLCLYYVTVVVAGSWGTPPPPDPLIPLLPIAAPNAEDAVCQNESRLLLEALHARDQWALKMWDASARDIPGLLAGNMYALGHFDECMSVRGPIRPQYCLVEVALPAAMPAPLCGVRRDLANLGVCIPASCRPEDLRAAAPMVQVGAVHCQPTEMRMLTVGALLYCLVMGILVLAVMAGTYYDYHQQQHTQHTGGKYLLYFSARRNVQLLTGAKHQPHPLDCISTIKLFSILLIILSHRASFDSSGPCFNGDGLDAKVRSLAGKSIQQVASIVDTFFLVGGLLFGYLSLSALEVRTSSVVITVLNRYLRLTPVYAVVIAFYALLLGRLGDGPLWSPWATDETEFCAENWWANLLYVNNYVREDRYCMVQSFFLSCDMQFVLLGTLLTRLLKKSPRWGVRILVASTAVSVLLPSVVTFVKQGPSLYHMCPQNLRYPRKCDAFVSFYIKSWARASPYLVGLGTGYYLYINRKSEEKFSKMTSLFLCGVCTMLTAATAVWGSSFYDDGRPYDAVSAAVYAGGHRLSWSLSVALFLVTLIRGDVPVIGPLLYWTPLVTIGNLGYGMFLVHMLLQYLSVSMYRVPQYTSFFGLLTSTTIDIVVSAIISLFLFLTVEIPFSHVAKDILNSRTKNKSK